MFESTWNRLAPFLVMLSLCCHQRSSSPSPEGRPAASIFTQLDRLPRAVGTYGAALGSGRGSRVQFWYPLASGAPSGNRFVSMREEIHSLAAGATKEQLTEMAECLRKQGISIQPEKSAAERHLLQAMTTRSVEESAETRPAIADGRFPMVILLHGSGDSDIRAFASIGENLAAHGFLVTGVQNATSAPGESAEDWQAKVFSIIAGLQGKGEHQSALLASVGSHVHFDRVGIVGHSKGGRVALLAMANEGHPGVLKAGVSLDGTMKSGEENATTPLPFLFLMLQMADSAEHHATARLVANNNKLPGGASQVLDLSMAQPQFKQVAHSNFNDAPLLASVVTAAVPSQGPTLSKDYGDMTNGESRRTNSIGFHLFINRTLVDFFSKHL